MIRKLIRICALCLAILLGVGGCSLVREPPSTPLSVTLLKVGKADAIVALCGSHALVIDAGEEEDGTEVVEFLQKHAVQSVDAMIITHFDQDHVGGADTVLERIPVKKVYIPDYQSTNREYVDFMQAARTAGVPLHPLREPVTLPLGSAWVLIEPPESYEIPADAVDYDNNFSLITTITHGKNRLVFMGDAEKQRIRQWLGSAVPCDFLKVPHHGVFNGALEELFTTLRPGISVICSSAKHPAEPRTLELLQRVCPRVFETRNGNVLLLSDGSRLEVRQKKK